MAPVVQDRILVILNRRSGLERGESALAGVRGAVREWFGSEAVVEKIVNDHAEAKAATTSFLDRVEGRALVVSGGGGGTLRAVIEGACAVAASGELPGADRLRIVALRMGSGNVLAKALGIPREPEPALRSMAQAVRAGGSVACCVGRYDFFDEERRVETRYAATLAGLGQLGRVPGDLERWHRRLGWLRRRVAPLVGIERLTHAEYGLALLARSIGIALLPRAAEKVEVRSGEEVTRLRLLAGAVLGFPVAGIPFHPGTGLGDASLSLHLVPYRSRWQALTLLPRAQKAAREATVVRVEPNRLVELSLSELHAVEMFLDEDPVVMRRRLVVSIAGTLAFVPGAEGVAS